MEEKYYSLGNAITGFGIAQSVALMITTISSVTLQQLFVASKCLGPLIVLLSGVVIYGGSVWRCWTKEKKLRKISGDELTPYESLFRYRLGAIVMFYAFKRLGRIVVLSHDYLQFKLKLKPQPIWEN